MLNSSRVTAYLKKIYSQEYVTGKPKLRKNGKGSLFSDVNSQNMSKLMNFP